MPSAIDNKLPGVAPKTETELPKVDDQAPAAQVQAIDQFIAAPANSTPQLSLPLSAYPSNPLYTRRADKPNIYPHLAQGIEIAAGITIYKNLELPAKTPVGTVPGFSTWSEIVDFANFAMNKTPHGGSAELVVSPYLFDKSQPDESVFNALMEVANIHSGRNLTLVVKGDPMDPDIVYKITPNQIISSENSVDEAAISYWKGFSVRYIIHTHLVNADKIEHALFYDALLAAHKEDHSSNLGEFLKVVIAKYNDGAKKNDKPQIPEDRLTEVYSRINELRSEILNIMTEIQTTQKLEMPPNAIFWNPVDTLLRKHPANNDPKNAWYSIGAGQMVATLEFVRFQMDCGKLPLDFRLIADDTYEPAIRELHILGEKGKKLDGVAVNPSNRKPFYAVTQKQRLELLAKYQPATVLFNLPASELVATFTDSKLIQLLASYGAVVATPSKAYKTGKLDIAEDKQGLLPYLDLYQWLKREYPFMADRLIVIGGFFEAKKILAHAPVSITIAGGSSKALETLARGMSPTPVDSSSRADSWYTLKLIDNPLVAANLQAGGSNKNFLTYRSAYLLMSSVLSLSRAVSEDDRQNLAERLQAEKKNNIQAGEEITSRAVESHYKIDTLHLWSSKGLKDDFRNCLPAGIDSLFEIKKEYDAIVADFNPEKLGQLIGKIVVGLGGGTRNAKDGYIDALLFYAFNFLKASKKLNDSYEDFYKKYYPSEFTGRGQLEGRKGIEEIIRYAQENNLVLPREVYEAFALYHAQGMEAQISHSETKRDFDTPEIIDTLWGLSKTVIQKFIKSLIGIKAALDHRAATGKKISSLRIANTIKKLLSNISEIKAEDGRIPLVTRRLLTIRNQLEILLKIFENSKIEPEQAAIVNDSFIRAIAVMTQGLHKRDMTVTELLSQLRLTSQSLYRIEMTLDPQKMVRLGLETGSQADYQEGAYTTTSDSGAPVETLETQGATVVETPGHSTDLSIVKSLSGLEIGDTTRPSEIIQGHVSFTPYFQKAQLAVSKNFDNTSRRHSLHRQATPLQRTELAQRMRRLGSNQQTVLRGSTRAMRMANRSPHIRGR